VAEVRSCFLHPVRRAKSARSSVAFLAALLVGLLGSTVSAEEPIEKRMDVLFGEHERYLAFFQELKDSVVRDDKKAVAGLLHYPLDVFRGGRRTVVRSPAEFLKRYHEVFNENVIRAVTSQEADALFANWRGVMLGHGQVWFSGVCADRGRPCADKVIRVITVNTDAPRT
jgi:hypothetical protein